MTKQAFRNSVIFSSILTVIVIMAIVFFVIAMFKKYAPPSENNTSIMRGTVSEVYYTVPGERVVVISLSNGEVIKLIPGYTHKNLFSTIGYDIEELANLLEGKTIEYRRMNELPWAVEIYVGDITIDNSKLTTHQIYFSRLGIVIIGLLAFTLAICADVTYLNSKYHSFQNAERKRIKKAKRQLKLIENKRK